MWTLIYVINVHILHTPQFFDLCTVPIYVINGVFETCSKTPPCELVIYVINVHILHTPQFFDLCTVKIYVINGVFETCSKTPPCELVIYVINGHIFRPYKNLVWKRYTKTRHTGLRSQTL